MTLAAGRRQAVSVRSPGRTAVPWLTVLPLAIVLAFADGFWLISLRTSVGAIARAQAPFASWLRESIQALPLFVFAVLGGLTLALSWFRSDLRRPRVVIASALLVVAASTVAGVGWLTASSAYDYHLQLQQVQIMGSMGGRCTGACLTGRQHASLLLQAKSVGYGSAILLVTNLVIVAWLLAMRGGRLEPAATGRRVGTVLPRGFTRADGLRLLLVAGLVGSAAVHAGMALAGRPAAGMLAIGVTAAQLAVAVRLMGERTRTGLVAAVVVSLGALALSAYSLSSGMPSGPHPGGSPPVGLAEGMSGLLEVGTFVAAMVLLRARPWLQRSAPSAHQMSLALVGVLALSVFGIAGTPLGW
jgi:hypothetical protein